MHHRQAIEVSKGFREAGRAPLPGEAGRLTPGARRTTHLCPSEPIQDGGNEHTLSAPPKRYSDILGWEYG